MRCALTDHTVFDIHDAVEDIERAVVVGDDEDAGVALVSDFGEEFHDLPTSLAVEGGGWLVGEDEAGIVGKGTCHSDALLLAAGEGDGQVVGALGDAEVVEQLHGTLTRGLGRGVVDFEGDLHVFQRGEEGDQIRFLKHKAEVLAAEGTQIDKRFGTIKDGRAVDGDLT